MLGPEAHRLFGKHQKLYQWISHLELEEEIGGQASTRTRRLSTCPAASGKVQAPVWRRFHQDDGDGGDGDDDVRGG